MQQYVAMAACFDETYECSTCCTSGKALNGNDCWGAAYTRARCCFAQLGPATLAPQTLTPPPFFFPPAASPTTPSPTASPVLCARDIACFDTNFECSGCCATGLARNGVGCWSGAYTMARCCNSAGSAAPPIVPTVQFVPTPVPRLTQTLSPSPFATCARDPTCFDENYVCSSCCSTGNALNGVSCWGGVYTQARCCSNGGTVDAPPFVTQFAATTVPTAQPTGVWYVWHGMAWHGTACGTAWHGVARNGRA